MYTKHGGDWAGYLAEYGRPALDFSANLSPLGMPRPVALAARRALGQAQLVLGAPRLLTLAKHLCSGPFLDAITPGEIQKILQMINPERAAVLYSGDLGFYSGAEGLRRALPKAELVSYPGISSVQYLAAKLGMPWQDWRFVSAHGADADPAPQLMQIGRASCRERV